ncbi:DoxX family membrane protein [Hymenobacter sp. NBH84]|uniref:DoxX family protein n=1 Tax=Hymenobacter sp. NBH84 TaxID=2596915 RepID=UPI00162401F6|nr:DoxX family membrane protein [Hymenobacter sp. NBH84]QNE41521.1 DoxX family membrane protein [Hymenobacter sp. NBH84]
MAFFLGLSSLFGVLWLVGWLVPTTGLHDSHNAARVAAAMMFLFVGISHFTKPEAMQYMVPKWLPVPSLLVYLSGALEVLFGLGLLFPATQQLSAWGLLVLLVLVFPANLHVAINNLPPPGGLPAKPWYVWSRLAFQPLYLAWVWYAALG